MNILQSIYRRTLNSVWFGILTMLLVGLYIAIGSGRPDVRAYFEMSDLEFFAAWPLKVLMGLLVVNLVCVTWERIPLTPPRYGVWCVHAGIITLIFGMGIYYNRKVEGLTIVPVGGTATRFYDSQARMLYVRVNDRDASAHTLPGLPRFNVYSPEKGNADKYFGNGRLQDLQPLFRNQPLSKILGITDDLRIDVVGYYPYARIVDQYLQTPDGKLSGVKLSLTAPAMRTTQTDYVVANDPGRSATLFGAAQVRHVLLPGFDEIEQVTKSAENLHTLDVQVGNFQKVLVVTPGGKYDLGDTGYSITVESFDPNWPTMDGQRAKLLTFLVNSPKLKYRRQVLMGRDKPTDWKLDDPAAGPLGKRQTEPLDPDLRATYNFRDPFRLAPDQGASERHTLFTNTDGKALVDVCVAGDRASFTKRFDDGKGDVELAVGPQFRAKVSLERQDNLLRDEHVEEIPPAQRTRQGGDSGQFQVLLARVRAGSFSQVVPVPFTQYALEPGVPWSGGRVQVPGSTAELQLQLSNEVLPLPAKITVEKFDLVHYPGGDPNSMLQRDFISHLLIEDPKTGKVTRDKAHMNEPAYWPPMPRSIAGYEFRFPWESAGDWLFFQAQWDPQGQRWTILGIGNRPGMFIMTMGCGMIFVGLLYAFYVKPIIIRRMKASALEKAQRQPKPEKKKELVRAAT